MDLLIRGADTVLTMDDAMRELSGADVLIRDGVIAGVGQGLATTGEVIEAKGCIVTPGLVNTHHHLYQSLTRAVPGGQDALLFGWLKTLYPIWARFGPEEMRISALVGLSERALGLHHVVRSPLPLPQRCAARRHHRSGSGGGPALSPHARGDEHWRKRRRAAAR